MAYIKKEALLEEIAEASAATKGLVHACYEDFDRMVREQEEAEDLAEVVRCAKCRWGCKVDGFEPKYRCIRDVMRKLPRSSGDFCSKGIRRKEKQK